MYTWTQFAAAKSNIFTSLGIDWQMLILQIVAFLLLVFALGKWVYPWLVKSVDDRQQAIDEAKQAAEQAKLDAESAEKKMEALLADARKQAAEIVAIAHLESVDMVSSAQAKAQANADRIVKEAHEQLDKDITAAEKMLHDQTLELVSLTTKKVVGKVNSKSFDNALIAEVLKGTK